MSKSMIELAYERMNHELELHWTRVNLTWVIVTVTLSAVGYLLFQISIDQVSVGADLLTKHALLHTLIVVCAAFALIASVAWRSIVESGNFMIQVWEQKIGYMEKAVNRNLYLELKDGELSNDDIRKDYEERFGIRAKPNPSITVVYNHLSSVVALGALILLVVLVVHPSELGIHARSDWRHYMILTAALIWSVLIKWPIAIDLRRNARILKRNRVGELQKNVIDQEQCCCTKCTCTMRDSDETS